MKIFLFKGQVDELLEETLSDLVNELSVPVIVAAGNDKVDACEVPNFRKKLLLIFYVFFITDRIKKVTRKKVAKCPFSIFLALTAFPRMVHVVYFSGFARENQRCADCWCDGFIRCSGLVFKLRKVCRHFGTRGILLAIKAPVLPQINLRNNKRICVLNYYYICLELSIYVLNR